MHPKVTLPHMRRPERRTPGECFKLLMTGHVRAQDKSLKKAIVLDDNRPGRQRTQPATS